MAWRVLMVIITIMITISIRPYTFAKVTLLGFALFCLSCLSSFGQSLYLHVSSTPYDRQMARIRPVLTSSAAGKQEQNLSFAVVNNWIGNLRAIPYGFSTEWKTPDEVQTSPYADCKGKAVALYNTMRSRGAENLRLVIGRRLPTSRKTHAWLEWNIAGTTYILDPTINWAAYRAERYGRHSYIPLYAYAGDQKFRASTTPTLYAKNQFFGGKRVASNL
jgi:hypothetical protein